MFLKIGMIKLTLLDDLLHGDFCFVLGAGLGGLLGLRLLQWEFDACIL